MRKIIQIVSAYDGNKNQLYALCDDGTWKAVQSIPQNNETSIDRIDFEAGL